MSVRSLLLLALSAVLAACASPAPSQAVIDYRGAGKPRAPHSATAPAVAAPASKPWTGEYLPAIVEAKALKPEQGQRPGGAKRARADDPKARRIVVVRGDTLYDLTLRHSVNLRALIETNKLVPPFALEPGQVILLPAPNVHVVEPGETLHSVSQRFSVDTRSLALLNRMERPWVVYPKDEIVLPPLAFDRTTGAPIPAPKSQPAAASKPAPTVAVAARKPDARRKVANPAGTFDFLWPVAGEVVRDFGDSPGGVRNDGVNIAAAAGSEVAATAGGEVAYAGAEVTALGNLVLIQHPGGWISAYGHADTLLVKRGDRVRQGQPIARIGATGAAVRPQLHFELRKGKAPVDPFDHLPGD
jgi:murein DD-endopeptidase MepM/ murein hydrolase activator NlpD